MEQQSTSVDIGKIDKKLSSYAGESKTLDEALSTIGFGTFQWRLMLVLAVGQMADAMEITLLSFLAPCVQGEWNLSPTQTSSITSVVFAGELIGSLCWGPLADQQGRRITYLLSLSVIFLAGVASVFAPNYHWLLFWRGMVGFGVGGGCVPFDFFAEVMPRERRGQSLVLLQMAWGGGSLLVALIALAGLENYGWRPLCLVCSFPVLAAGLVSAVLLPESPRWLLVNGRDSEAKKIVLDAANLNGVQMEGFILKKYQRNDKLEEELGFSELLSPTFIKTTLPLAIIWACIGFGYYSTVLIIALVFESGGNGGGCSFDEFTILVSASAEMLAIFLLKFTIDTYGRKASQILMYSVNCVTAMSLGSRALPHTMKMVASFLARGSAVAGFSATWIHTPELYPTKIRTTAHSALYSIARIAAFSSAYWVYSSIPLLGRTGLISMATLLAAIMVSMLQETNGEDLDSANISNSQYQHGKNNTSNFSNEEAESLISKQSRSESVEKEGPASPYSLVEQGIESQQEGTSSVYSKI